MRRTILRFGLIGGGAGLAALVTLLVSCLDDPRANEEVRTVDTCDMSQLSSDAANPQASLRAYVEATDELLQRATAVETELKDACNAVDTELGLATGADALSACNAIGARVSKIAENQAKPPAPFLPNWAELRFVSACEAPPDTLAKCLNTCTAGPCDVSKCEQNKLVAVCQGECQGTCLSRGENLPCTGACIGDVAMTEPSTCGGECEGICTGPNWYGHCDGACAGAFVGRCEGTCTGKCNGQDINIVDAGAPDAGGDAGGDGGDAGGDGSGGGGGGGPPPLVPPATNAPGNCQGVCVGVCSNGAEGLCLNAPCLAFNASGPPDLAKFSGGNCFSGTCGGVCKSAFGNSSPTTCTGQCAQRAKECKGLCAGPCVGQTTNPICMGNLACGQNAECENACQAKAQLAQVCKEPTTLEEYAISDPALLAAWKKHGPRLAKAVSQIRLLRAAFGFVGSRAYGDFVAIGLKGDLIRACVAKGNSNVSQADAKIRAMGSADPTLPKESSK